MSTEPTGSAVRLRRVQRVFVDNIKLDMIVRTGAPPVLRLPSPKPLLIGNMDDKQMYGGYGGYNWSANSLALLHVASEAGQGVGGSKLTLTWISALAARNTPAWAAVHGHMAQLIQLLHWDSSYN